MELRAVIIEDDDYDPADYLSGDELDRKRGEIANGEIVVVGVCVQEMCKHIIGCWHLTVHSLWGIEIDPVDVQPFPLASDDIPLGPYNVLSLFPAGATMAQVPANLAAPYTASENHLVQVACDLFIEARER